MSQSKHKLYLILAILGCVLPAQGSIIVYGSHTGGHRRTPSRSLSDVRMEVSLAVSGSVATFTFANVSTGLETSAVVKEIVIDRYDNDTGLSILWDGEVITHTCGVRFRLRRSNGLRGFRRLTRETPRLAELRAKSRPIWTGLSVGETLVVQFDTSLPDGSGVIDYLSAFGGGQDTGLGALGFLAIRGACRRGGVSGISTGSEIPEPASATLLLLGGVVALKRRRRARQTATSAWRETTGRAATPGTYGRPPLCLGRRGACGAGLSIWERSA
ncbi:MAG: PEP-CTERM sorting domain-containing protein [Phycisphaerae bacterium]|nr:PEP-CTERM sorting domain-containing protein [Phycisphaerae bacterium]